MALNTFEDLLLAIAMPEENRRAIIDVRDLKNSSKNANVFCYAVSMDRKDTPIGVLRRLEFRDAEDKERIRPEWSRRVTEC